MMLQQQHIQYIYPHCVRFGEDNVNADFIPTLDRETVSDRSSTCTKHDVTLTIHPVYVTFQVTR